MDQDPFKEYLIQTEPNKIEKRYAWHTAIGLQAVDGLRPSKYLVDTALQNIEGKISIDEAQRLLDVYYRQNHVYSNTCSGDAHSLCSAPVNIKENSNFQEDERTEEADKVSIRIVKILSEKAFSFTPNEYISIHKKLFTGIYEHAGRVRDHNITKKEWVLDGETVLYGSASELRTALDYCFLQEKAFSYKGLSFDEIIHHLAVFVSSLWQIHIFSEGTTRTTAVFFIMYLRTLGFQATNYTIAENAWYFRNALVRANYTNLVRGIHETTEFLELFLNNLLCDEHNELHNRAMHVNELYKNYPKVTDTKVDITDIKVDIADGNLNIADGKVNIADEKVNIADERVDIADRKVNITDAKVDIADGKMDINVKKTDIEDTTMDIDISLMYGDAINKFSLKTKEHIKNIFAAFGTGNVFGRTEMQKITDLGSSRASALLKELVNEQIIEVVSGHGKGKYRFSIKISSPDKKNE